MPTESPTKIGVALHRYRCHKEVWAVKIKEIRLAPAGDHYIIPDGANIAIEVSEEYRIKHKPEVGGYYVRYADGYESFSPAKAFEEGYTLITDPPTTIHANGLLSVAGHQQQPTICRILIYTLSADDALKINRRRTTGQEIADRISLGHWPMGAQAHIGAFVSEGDEFPMMVVACPQSDDVAIRRNGQVFLDGSDSFWVQNAAGNAKKFPGTWRFPELSPSPARPPADIASQAG